MGKYDDFSHLDDSKDETDMEDNSAQDITTRSKTRRIYVKVDRLRDGMCFVSALIATSIRYHDS